MVLGQSSATAAALAIDGKLTVQQVDYGKLREKLLADKQVLDWVGPKPGEGRLDPAKLPGVVVDDEAATLKGFTSVSTVGTPYVGKGYRHDGNTDKGKQSARFTPKLSSAGEYEVRLAYSPNPNRASNVPVTIHHADGEKVVKVNQKQTPPLDKAFVSLGKFRFEASAFESPARH